MICSIVFDFDGTLVQSNAIKKDAYYQVARAFGVSHELIGSVLIESPGATRFEIFQQLIHKLGSDGSSAVSGDQTARSLCDEMVVAYGAICEREIAGCPETPGAHETLAHMSNEGVSLYINSATPLEALRHLVQLRGFDRHVKGIFGASQGKFENLSAISAEDGVKPDETLVVGDGDDDWAAARRFGSRFVGVIASGDRFSNQPAEVVRDLRELPQIVARLG